MFFNHSIDKFANMVNKCATFQNQNDDLGQPYVYKPFKTPQHPNFRKSAYQPPINNQSHPATYLNQNSIGSVFSKSKPRDELDLAAVYYNLKQFKLGYTALKIFDEVPIISVLHNDEDSNYRLDIKYDELKNGKPMQIDLGNLNIIFYCRHANLFKYKQVSQRVSENFWKFEKGLDRFKFGVVFKSAVDLFHFRDSLFCDKLEIVEISAASLEDQHREYLKKCQNDNQKESQKKENCKQSQMGNQKQMGSQKQNKKESQKDNQRESQKEQYKFMLKEPEPTSDIEPMALPFEHNQIEEDEIVPKFTYGAFDQSFENKKLKSAIVGMKEKDKLAIISNIFRIKKEEYKGTKSTRCPIWNCSITLPTYHQLKHHVKKEHPYLQQNGIIHSDYEFSYEYTQKALNLALYLGKTQPQEMKKLIKMMKHTFI